VNTVRVCVIEAKGSTPRDVGAAMVISQAGLTGTIGGGALEHDATAWAQKLLNHDVWYRETKAYPLGPSLGQCCGGYTKLLFEVMSAGAFSNTENGLILRSLESGTAPIIIQDRHTRQEDWPLSLSRVVQDMLSGAQTPAPTLVNDAWYVEPVKPTKNTLFLYGAGHVGRAVVSAMAGLPFHIMWVDTAADRFPDNVPDHASATPATAPATIARHAPNDAWHMVMTYSHTLDLAICQAVLDRGQFSYLGVIGSKTKRARFTRRLGDSGISPGMVDKMICPVGLPDLDGKEPSVIAISIAADLLQRLSSARYVSDTISASQLRGTMGS
jgi:xanthine dehydrogenase accessory factor